jgi:GT2 family glycosyltransferase
MSFCDIVIPHYKNELGLKQCLASIEACTNRYGVFPVTTIVVYAVREDTGRRMNFAETVNAGIKKGNSEYVCILNDDVIVSDHWLRELMKSVIHDKTIGAVGPLSNCDKGWLHNHDIKIGGVDLLPGSNTVEQITPIIPQIYDYASPYHEVIERDWIAMYCTLIPREVINKVGLLDEKFENSGEDVEWCHRARKAGYKIVQDYNSFVFHYGAVSRKQLEAEDYQAYHDADKRTTEYLRQFGSSSAVVLQ